MMTISFNVMSLIFLWLGMSFGSHITPLGGMFFLGSVVTWIIMEEYNSLLVKLVSFLTIMINALLVGIATF